MQSPLPSAEGGAAAVIFDGGGRVLLVKEGYERRRWSLPGGAVERGETPEEAAERETLEETALNVSIRHRIGTYTLDNGFSIHAFLCAVVGGEPTVPDTGEIEHVEWHPYDSLPRPRSNILHYAVPDAVRGARDLVRQNLPRIS